MPITGASSYVPTCQSFLAHWAEVDAALPGPEVLTLAGALIGQPTPVTRVTLETLFGALRTQRDTVTETLVEVDLARGAVATLKASLALRISQFIGVVRGNLAGTKYERSLPAQPDAFSTQDALQSAAIRVRKLWETLNADAATGMSLPLLLEGGLSFAQFKTTLVDAVPTVYFALETATSALRLDREERNDLQAKIYPILKAYRQVVPTKFPPGSALAEALPDLSPRAGATPEPVALTATWNAAAGQAQLSWTASTDAALAEYEVRAVPGPDYSGDDEVVVASVPAGGALALATDQFLAQAGQQASFKVYVLLTTGNEAGSNAVTVARPA